MQVPFMARNRSFGPTPWLHGRTHIGLANNENIDQISWVQSGTVGIIVQTGWMVRSRVVKRRGVTETRGTPADGVSIGGIGCT